MDDRRDDGWTWHPPVWRNGRYTVEADLIAPAVNGVSNGVYGYYLARDSHRVATNPPNGFGCTDSAISHHRTLTGEPMTTTEPTIDTEAPATPRYAFWINEAQEAGPRGHIPSVVFEGVSGHYPMVGQGELAQPWYWGDTATAKDIARRENAKLGLTSDDVLDIITSSMFAENTEHAARDAAFARYTGAADVPPMEAFLRDIFNTGGA